MSYSEIYNRAFYYAAANEGECSNHPMDKGGYTRFGISLQLMKSMFKNGTYWLDKNGDGIITKTDSDKLSSCDIKRVYYDEFWSKLEKIPYDELAIKMFDVAVNIGVGRAIKMLQRVVDVIDDGVIGPQTVEAIEKTGTFVIAERLTEELEKFYIWRTFVDKSQQCFLRGWLKRAKKWPDTNSEIAELRKLDV